jgi:DNA-binding LacI/PurR family transcriptional regulator
MKIDRASADPLHKQIERQIRQQIETGVYPPRKALPSIRRLADSLAVNHLTVRRALGSLIAEGLLVSNAGSGTFVKEPTLRGSTVALIMDTDGTELPAKVSLGARQVLEAQGVDMVVRSDHDDDRIQAEEVDRLGGNGTRGAIIEPFGGPAGTHAILRQALAGFPVVLVPGCIPGIPISCVTLDFETGAYTATKHLIDRGRRRVAIIGNVNYSTARQRIEGFRRAMGEHGLPVHPAHVLPNIVTLDEVRAATSGLLEARPRPDAIIYGNDYRALAALQVIHGAGLKVPDDVAVVGSGNFQVASLAQPPLTTMGYDVVELGRAAAAMLLELIGVSVKERREPRTRVMPVTLVCREST